ncbi:MAG: metal ABC transporter permease [Beijerinckiaceae bacterium]
MLDDFFIRAMLAGIAIALVAGPLGSFVVWRRMAYFGATMSHGALLGVALAFLLNIDPMLGVLIQGLLIVPAFLLLERYQALSADTLLGILAHGTLALGLVIFGFMTWVRIDLMAFLFGDILAVSKAELLWVWIGAAAVLAILAVIWRPLLASTVSAEIAAAEGQNPERNKLVFMILIAAIIAVSMKIVGILLILSMLIIPPAAARTFARTPEQMAVIASAIAILATIGGLYASLQWNTASGPSIVVAALALFLASMATRALAPKA